VEAERARTLISIGNLTAFWWLIDFITGYIRDRQNLHYQLPSFLITNQKEGCVEFLPSFRQVSLRQTFERS
jgi:hypothetical protein